MAFDADDLSPTEQFVVDRTREGEVADFTPMLGADGTKPAIRAGFLRKLLLQLEPGWAVRSPGVRVKGARIDGALDLSDCTGLPALSLEGCELPEAIDISHARLARLSLCGSQMVRLNGKEAAIDGELNLQDISPLLQTIETLHVHLRSARIDGDLVARRARLARALDVPQDEENEIVLYLQGADITGNVFLDGGFEALGCVWLSVARIAGVLQCSGGQFLNRSDDGEGQAIMAENAHIGAGVDLSDQFKAEGGVSFSGARLAGPLVLDGASFRNDGALALDLSNAELLGEVSGAMKVAGEVSFQSASIAGNLDLRGAELSNPRPRGAQGVGEFDTALDASNVRVGGALRLQDAKVKGEVILAHARIEDSLGFGGGRFLNTGGVVIRARNARIGGNVNFRTDGGADEAGPVARKTVVEGDAKFDRARIEGELAWHGLELRGKGADGQPAVLSFADCEIARSLCARVLHAQAGRIDLSGATCAALDDDLEKGWGIATVKVDVEGFTFDRLDGAETGWRQRLKWLKERAATSSPQPYAALARIYARTGRPDDMRRALRAQAVTRNDARPYGISKFLSGAFDLFAGYGFSTKRIAISLLIYLFIGVAGVLAMDQQRALITADGRACNGAIEPALYAIDVALPILDLGQADVCAPGRAPGSALFAGVELSRDTDWRLFEGVALFRWALALYAVLGAVLTALAVITFSGVMKPKSED